VAPFPLGGFVRFILLALAFGIVAVTATSARATSYDYWVCSGNNGSGDTCTVPYGQSGTWFATGVEACQANDPRSAGYPGDVVSPFWNDAYPTAGICWYDADPPGSPITWALATHYTINCTDPQVIDLANHSCGDPAPTCPSGQVWDATIGFCVTPKDCSGTVGDVVDGNVQPVGPGPSSMCSGGCEYATSDFIFTSADYGYFRFTGTGATCSGSTPAPTPAPLPEPTPETPTEPTTPEDPIPTPDPGTEGDPATQGNQHTISNQLHGLAGQMGNLESGQGKLINQGNTTNSLLTNIANQLQEGNGTGSSGNGTSDQDGDGTDDSFSDGGCLTAPTCNGPAVECAIAFQAYNTRCNLQITDPAATEATVMADVGVTQTVEEILTVAPEDEHDASTMFTSPTPAGGSCPADYSVSTSLGSVSFSWGPICEFGTDTRPVVLLAAWIVAGMMFYNALLRNWG